MPARVVDLRLVSIPVSKEMAGMTEHWEKEDEKMTKMSGMMMT